MRTAASSRLPRSHTGKSTVAYGLNRRGYEQWADDGVVLEVGDGRALAVPLPFDVRLRPESSGMFGPTDRGSISSRRWTLSGVLNGNPPPSAPFAFEPIDRVLVGSPVTIERLEPAQAFAPCSPRPRVRSSNLDRRRRMLQTYLELLDVVPCATCGSGRASNISRASSTLVADVVAQVCRPALSMA
jgi:hypothetical protein